MKNSDKKTIIPGGVDEYIKNCPEEVRDALEEIRAAIRALTPGAIETVSYFQFPGYSYEGYDYNGMFVWFSYKEPYIRLHVRPPVIKNHAEELKGYPSSTGIVNFPMNEKIPIVTVKKLVKASLAVMKS
jgi:uncharacterized protein YdhG (YjbR/CyaY superfamily)